MKKSLVAALTTALVVGAASTTFAAVNPFTDVPADHWAYDAVTQLAADGVIEGYGDGTFLGENEITRYEMAQMIAKAMARTDVSATDRALIDKLAAEFADELNNLGVRVANLERNADMVKWNGEMRYTYESNRDDGAAKTKSNSDTVKFRLEPSAEVNNHWHVKSRLDADIDMSDDTSSADVKMKRIWAQGDYDNFTIKLGKFAPIDSDNIFDTNYSGAEVSFGNQLKATIGAGRMSDADVKDDNGVADVSNYQYYGLDYKTGKFNFGAHYHHLNAEFFTNDTQTSKAHYVNYKDNGQSDEMNTWLLRTGYRFDKSAAIQGFYAENHDADQYEKAYSYEFDYKGANKANKGSWGAWAAYRYLGDNVAINSTYDAIKYGQKGWEIGANYTLMKNVVTTLRYGNGEDLVSGKDIENLFGRVQFFF